MTTPDRDRATDRLSNPDSRSAEPSGARSAPAPIAVPPRASVDLGGGQDSLRGAAGERDGRRELRSRVRFRPQVGLLEQRALLSAPAHPHGADRLDRFGGLRTVGHVHRDRQRLVCGRGDSERGDGHLQRPERSDRQRDAGRRRGGVHDLEPGGGHDHRHGLLRRHRGLRPEHHGHDRDRRRQRHRRLHGRQRARDRRRAERPLWRRRRLRGRPVHRRLRTTTWSARWSRRPATSSPSPATAPPVTAATAGPRPPPS